MEFTTKLTYPKKNIDKEDLLQSICEILPTMLGSKLERESDKIIFWHDGKLRAFKKPGDFFLYGEIEIQEENKNFHFKCSSGISNMIFWIGIAVFAVLIILYFMPIYVPLVFVLGFPSILIVGNAVIAPRRFKRAMKKLLDNAYTNVTAPNIL